MKLRYMNEIPTSREMIDVFGGYNHNLRISENEFYDMKNLTSTDYPVLSPRPQRGIYAEPAAPNGMIEKDVLCYIDGENFVIEGQEPIDMGFTDTPKSLISMGAYVIIMPDKKYINTNNYADRGSIEASVTTDSTVTFELCKQDGTAYENVTVSSTAPRYPSNMALWLDTSSVPNVLKQYSSTISSWTAVAATYIKISSTGLGAPFAVNDGVTISGVTVEALSDLNSTMVIWDRGDDYIIVTGIINQVESQAEPITVTRNMPTMDFIIESGNRLWGCHYGQALNGEMVNEIYASKLGDFKNWNSFAGISTDSYAASVGTDGQFTGAVTHLGYPIFFKENFLHKVYGNYPSNYQIQTTACRGVQRGCSKSLAIVNEVLYYKSRSAVCAYDGSLPVEISSQLGDAAYENAVAGAVGNKYYLSMSHREVSGDIYTLFVYDTKRGFWHKEDNTHALDFCASRGELYFIDVDTNENKKIKTVLGSGTSFENEINWRADSGVIGTSSPDKKYVSRLDVRLMLEVGTRVYFYIDYDSIGEWHHLYTMTGTTLKSFSIPLRLRRCDHFRLRIEGNGMAKIYSICKTIEDGSEL